MKGRRNIFRTFYTKCFFIYECSEQPWECNVIRWTPKNCISNEQKKRLHVENNIVRYWLKATSDLILHNLKLWYESFLRSVYKTEPKTRDISTVRRKIKRTNNGRVSDFSREFCIINVVSRLCPDWTVWSMEIRWIILTHCTQSL